MKFSENSAQRTGSSSMRRLLLVSALTLTGCVTTGGTPTSEIDAALQAMRRDICSRIWRGVTTSRHDVLTDQTAFEIAQDTAARAAYCKGVL